MKFTDGYWMMRDGVRPLYPAEVRDVVAESASLTVHAPTRRITHRGDTLNTPVITVTCTSPMPDVIGVRISHLRGGRAAGPEFRIATEDCEPQVTSDDDTVTFTSGALGVRFSRGDRWGMEFLADGATLTSSGPKAMAALDTDDGGHYLREQLALDVDTHVYGLGERFGPLVKNGQVVDVWNADGGTSSEQAYKNVPFYLTDSGYGVFVNHPGAVSFEVGSEAVSRVQFSVPGQQLSYFVIYGPTPREILQKYTALTGRPALPPAWSFGLWLTTSFTTSYDEETVTGFISGMAERDIPLSVFHFDCFWMREFHWCDFRWDPATFPDPEGMLTRLKERGLRICVWINPYIAQRSALFSEGAAAGYLLRKPSGDVWQTDQWQAGMALVDFTNPAARDWYAGKLRALLDSGVDCFKSDFGERIPTDVAYFDDSDPYRMHNYYSYLYNETVFEVLRERHGDGGAVLFARSATAGSQQFPVHWGGDSESTFASMAESLRGGLSLAMSGFGFWSHDIGGFEGTPDPAVFIRWIPFGLLSSHSRLHGSGSYRVPWLFGDKAVEVLREYTRLKARLMPYLYAAALDAHRDGTPVMRPLVFEFPDDPACAYLDRQYLLGDNLLVAPVFSAEGDTSFYVPAGGWTDLRTGEVFSGPGWHRRRYALGELPLLVRPGSVIPMGARDDGPEYAYADGVTLRVYHPRDRQEITVAVPDPSGATAATFTVTRDWSTIVVERDGTPAPWRVLLVGESGDATVTGGRALPSNDGVLVEVDAVKRRCLIQLGPQPTDR
ncbi:alpha-xylosidase [Planosporangium mesophilum]|uniref:alpha-D-xyloside xylohydrolase n=1 Tax=Planosporangium mesophilum TaxID=689768 RepID=A0A8J3TEP7_9ACTN|nr:alpha-xylosidase [Planosporangium mesophilum]NJC85096.1 alpha-xylosidase [Planosporangium mesophilum]GII24452.1 alpha-xylosidase [Planosporangium mesophilum]